MNILRNKFTCVLAILTFTLNIRMCVQITHEKSSETMSGDFESFLNSLGSMVYKYKKATRVEGGGQRRDEYSFIRSSTMPTQISMRNESIFKTQKAILRDVLMMKLVSYYENKYKITDHVPTSPDISVHSENNTVNDTNALSQMKRTEHTQSNLKSVVEVPNEEVRVI